MAGDLLMNLPLEVSTFSIAVATVGLATLLILILLAMLRVVRWVLGGDPIQPSQAVDRLGQMVDDEQRARLHKRMREAR